MDKKGLTTRAEDYNEWYLEVIAAADLAEHSEVKGCMIIKPYGYAIWENIQKILDKEIKATGHRNAYFPLFIPKSFLSKEASHIDGFAKECAVVTHYRLKGDAYGAVIVDPDSQLEEELVVRPTSETIIYSAFSKWIQSWRDLPLLINQWANVVRWEMRTRLFLRTTEFLWQEGHTAHANEQEAEEEARKMLDMYQDFSEKYLAIAVIAGQKTENEKFPGALRTYSIEALMQDKKALQAGTSHNLGQNFARPFNVSFTDALGAREYVWQTSWGVSTRLIGGLIMSHSDDKGLVLPPLIAPIKIVIIPIWKTEEERARVFEQARILKNALEAIDSECMIDERDYCSPGFKFNEWEKKGVPIRVELGPKDIAAKSAVIARRDTGTKETVLLSELFSYIGGMLDKIQSDLFARSKKFQKEHSHRIDDYTEFKKLFSGAPGFIYSHWCGGGECEARISEDTKATIRCIPFDPSDEKGECIVCKSVSLKRALFAKAY